VVDAATAASATQTTAQEKTTLEAKVADLQQDLVLAGVDLKTANDHVVDLVAKLQSTTYEGTRFRETVATRDQDIQSK
jgi:hypothetical protein